MLDEISEQPSVVRSLVSNLEIVRPICDAILGRDIRQVYIVARGTSDHAAHYAKYLFEIEHGFAVALAAPSTLTLYGSGPRFDEHSLVISISQSGAGADVCTYIEDARRKKALTLAITNTADSPLAGHSEYTIITPAGIERSVAATKTYTSALATIAMISTCLALDPVRREELNALPDVLEGSLQVLDSAKRLASTYKDLENCVVLGRGYNYSTALELGLKLTETSAIGAQAFSSADFQHGPIARVVPGFPCILIAPEGAAYTGMCEIADKLASRLASLIVLTSSPEAFPAGASIVKLPPIIPEWLSPIAYIIAGQLFAHELALAKGKSPDCPIGLSKVTSTM